MDLTQFPLRRAAAGAMAILSLSLTLPIATSAEGRGEGPIDWRGNYSSALEEARSRGCLLWIQFTGPWCPNCVRMERDSFVDPAVCEQANAKFVALKLRVDEHQEMALGFELSGLPATVIVAPTRDVVAVRQGYLGPRELDAILSDAGTKHDASRGEKTLVASSRDAPEESSAGQPAKDGPKAKPKRETELALSGYCPVSLVSDKQLVRGQTEYTVSHEGRLYRFANLITFNLFRGDPARYVPVNRGFCPVAQLDRSDRQAGDPRYGVLFQGRLYLCATLEDRRTFLEEPARYAAIDVAERGHCPHCLASEGRLVPGDPRYDLDRDGRRYWFPDPTHREAFLTALGGTSPTQR